jgi:hypothetical protein
MNHSPAVTPLARVRMRHTSLAVYSCSRRVGIVGQTGIDGGKPCW